MSRFHPKDAPKPKPRKVVEENHSFNRNPKMGTRNRLPWTAEEKEALIRGLYKYGVGAWSKIVDDITISSVVSVLYIYTSLLLQRGRTLMSSLVSSYVLLSDICIVPKSHQCGREGQIPYDGEES